MKTNKKPATGPSTDGSNTTPHGKEALTDKDDVKKKDEEYVFDGAGSDDNDD